MKWIKFNLQNSFDKVRLLVVLQIILVVFSFILEGIFTQSILNITFFIQFAILVVTLNFYYQALLNLYYSFWNLSAILIIFELVSAFRNILVLGNPAVGFFYLVSIGLLLISCYIISSPLYYPLVNWWEYDFRFRADIRVWVESEGKRYRGRLSDLRRGAGCLEVFENVAQGSMVWINLEILGQNFTLQGQIRSKREPIIGRTFIYGIKFTDIDLEHRQRMRLLINYWNESKKIKIRNKFASNK